MQGSNVIPIMNPSATATAIIDTQQKNHQTDMECSHCKADTIYSDVANKTSAILTNLQCNTCLIKCWNLKHTIQHCTNNDLSLFLSA